MAAIRNELGVVLRRTGRLAESRDLHLQALETLRHEPAEAAGTAESRFELARTYSFLSSQTFGHHSRRSSPTGAERVVGPSWGRGSDTAENNRHAREILEKLLVEAPENPRYRLAMAHNQRDRFLIHSRSHATAEQEAEREEAKTAAIHILERLVADVPANSDYRYELAETYVLLCPRSSDAAISAGDVTQLRRALEIGSDLVARYPTVPEYKRSLARSHTRLAEAMQQANSWDEAEKHFSKALDLRKSLASDFPAVPIYRLFLCHTLERLAKVQIERQELPQARASADEAIATLKEMEPSAADVAPSPRALAYQYGSWAKILQQLGENALADEANAKGTELGSQSEASATFGGFHHERHRTSQPE
jgi:tetratricopeptide (TPR) repeat protein